MSVKQFFKSTAFKCIVTLLCVLLVSGIFLTIMHGLLEVTDEEREARSLSKIYGSNAKIEKTLEISGSYDDATIDKGYLMEDGNYLIKSTGLGAYSGGSVTCWVVVNVTGNAVSGIGKVVIESNTKQTLMSQFTDSVLNQFSTNYNPNQPFDGSVITGATATLTKNAICNAVNAATSFVQTQFGPTWVSPYTDFAFTKYINVTQSGTTHEVKADGSVEYHVVTKGYEYPGAFKIDIEVKDGLITKYNITKNGSTDNTYANLMPANVKDGTLFIGKGPDFFTGIYGEDMNYVSITGSDDNSVIIGATEEGDETIASNSTYLCMYAGAFATANYKNCLFSGVDPFEGLELLTYINVKTTTYDVKADGSVKYHVVTRSYDEPNSFTIDITVKDGVITEYEIVKNGSTSKTYENAMPDSVRDGTLFEGKGIEYFTGLYGDAMNYKAIESANGNDITIGASTVSIASKSTYLCMYAGAFATKNYEKAVAKYTLPTGGETNE